METNDNLAKQIAELTAKHNLQTSVESKLIGIPKVYTNHFNYGGKGTIYTITAYLDECPLNEIADKIQIVLKAFPATKNNTLTFAGKDNQPTESPFVLRFENNIRDRKAQIEYVSGEYWVHIKLPVNYYSDDVKGVFMRKVYDSEYHYFGGTSMAEINRMQIRAYKLDMFESVKYYGGDTAHFIKDVEDKAEFECVVLYGHTPQFKEFWQKQLTNQ